MDGFDEIESLNLSAFTFAHQIRYAPNYSSKPTDIVLYHVIEASNPNSLVSQAPNRPL